MIKLSPSILAADLGHLQDEIQKTAAAEVDYIHLDIMDGHFVPNLTFGPELVKYINSETDIPLDVHLMISNPGEYLEIYAAAGADYLTIHYEAVEHPEKMLETIRSLGIKSGITVSPNTPVEVVEPYLEHADWLLIMSVHPGFAGQRFIPDSVKKVNRARQYIDGQGLKCEIAIDGGIDLKTAPRVASAGAEILITGSSFYRSGNYGEFARRIKEVTAPH
ncbi:MAG: ribulose-phosphate 3-epimerase [Candidatus Zixiibacteriota bacterium]